jgi:hypothetical protein
MTQEFEWDIKRQQGGDFPVYHGKCTRGAHIHKKGNFKLTSQIDEQEERFGPRREYTEFEYTIGHIMPELVVSDFPKCMDNPEAADDNAPPHTDMTWVCHDMHHSGCNGELSGNSEWCHCPCHFSEKNGHWKAADET